MKQEHHSEYCGSALVKSVSLFRKMYDWRGNTETRVLILTAVWFSAMSTGNTAAMPTRNKAQDLLHSLKNTIFRRGTKTRVKLCSAWELKAKGYGERTLTRHILSCFLKTRWAMDKGWKGEKKSSLQKRKLTQPNAMWWEGRGLVLASLSLVQPEQIIWWEEQNTPWYAEETHQKKKNIYI